MTMIATGRLVDQEAHTGSQPGNRLQSGQSVTLYEDGSPHLVSATFVNAAGARRQQAASLRHVSPISKEDA